VGISLRRWFFKSRYEGDSKSSVGDLRYNPDQIPKMKESNEAADLVKSYGWSSKPGGRKTGYL
jgi:hypothetical protein